jgi:hypothetical protein
MGWFSSRGGLSEAFPTRDPESRDSTSSKEADDHADATLLGVPEITDLRRAAPAATCVTDTLTASITAASRPDE